MGSVHTNKALAKIAVGYRNEDYVLGGIAPTVGVTNESDSYYIWTKGEVFADQAQIVRPGARAPRSGIGLTTATYTTNCYKWAWPVPDRILANADQAVKAEIGSTRAVMDKLLLSKERVISTLLVTTGNWTTTAAIAAGSEWDTAGGGDPIGDVETAVTTVQGLIGRQPNTIAMSWPVYRALRAPSVLAEVFDIPRVFIVKARYNSAVEGATVVMADVMTDTVWVGYVSPTPSIMEPSAAYVFEVGGPKIKTFREEAEEQDVVEGQLNYDAKAVVADAGYTITNCLA
jgi:hypothetical protein